MIEQNITPLIEMATTLGRAEAKKELANRIVELHSPLDIATEVILWLKESDVKK